MTKKILLIFIILLISVGLFASDTELSGKEIAANGSLLTLSGTFEMEDDEWYLQTDVKLYIIHKGLDWYTEEIGFLPPEGKQVTIEGFVLENEVSPCTIFSENTSYAFRSSEGYPLWGGRGNRSNERTDGFSQGNRG
jgi:hypothetical protein